MINRVLNRPRGNSTCQKKRDVIRRRAATQNDGECNIERERGKMDERKF